ncbi:MAG: hypothetical protein WCG27_13210, partial [Pseudomonadota bacterium]
YGVKLESKNLSRQVVEDKKQIYENLTYKCRSMRVNDEHRRTEKAFRNVYLALNFLSTVTIYSYVNRDRPKDAQWFGKLGFDSVVGTIQRWFLSKMRANPLDGFWAKYYKNNIFYASTDLVVSPLYDFLFGQIPKWLDSRQNQAQEELIRKLEEKHFDEAIVKNMVSIPTLENEEILTPERTERYEEEILQNVTNNLYEEEKGDWIATGNKGLDRYVFHRLFNASMSTASVGFSLWIYHTICMGKETPSRALAQAIGIYAIDKALIDTFYFETRREAINQ